MVTEMAAAADLHLPPGFRFHPTDEELVMHYLCRKCASQPITAQIIADIDLYKYDPWDLPGMAWCGDKEWYFFSPRDRKYPNGSRPNRAAGTGYWKATGIDKPIGRPKPVGIKKALVFYSGKSPKGDKTNWIMHEYRLADVDRSAPRQNNSRLDDWVLCRIYNKKGFIEKPQPFNRKTVLPVSNCDGDGEKLETETAGFPVNDWGNAHEFPINYLDTTLENELASRFLGGNRMRPAQDMFVNMLQNQC